MQGGLVAVLVREALMCFVSPSINGNENNDSRRQVADLLRGALQLGHHILGVEHVTKELLLVGRREVLNLATDVRGDFGRHDGTVRARRCREAKANRATKMEEKSLRSGRDVRLFLPDVETGRTGRGTECPGT